MLRHDEFQAAAGEIEAALIHGAASGRGVERAKLVA